MIYVMPIGVANQARNGNGNGFRKVLNRLEGHGRNVVDNS